MVMNKITKRYKDEYIKMDDLVLFNTTTDEIKEFKNASLIKRTDEGIIQYNSSIYNIIDNDVLLKCLIRGVKQVDLGLLLTISNNLRMNYNICLDSQNNPLTTKSISKIIGQTEQNTKRKLNRLVKSNLLYYGKYWKKKMFGKVYIVNPQIIRKGHKFCAGIPQLFLNLNKNVQEIYLK